MRRLQESDWAWCLKTRLFLNQAIKVMREAVSSDTAFLFCDCGVLTNFFKGRAYTISSKSDFGGMV